jgi:hypothetical protein
VLLWIECWREKRVKDTKRWLITVDTSDELEAFPPKIPCNNRTLSSYLLLSDSEFQIFFFVDEIHNFYVNYFGSKVYHSSDWLSWKIIVTKMKTTSRFQSLLFATYLLSWHDKFLNFFSMKFSLLSIQVFLHKYLSISQAQQDFIIHNSWVEVGGINLKNYQNQHNTQIRR